MCGCVCVFQRSSPGLSQSFQGAAPGVGDVEGGDGGEQLALLRGAVVVRRDVGLQQGGDGEVG